LLNYSESAGKTGRNNFSDLIDRLFQDGVLEANLSANLPPCPSLVLPAEHGRDRTQPLFVDLGFAFGGWQVE
jgi:hypothetical protein